MTMRWCSTLTTCVQSGIRQDLRGSPEHEQYYGRFFGSLRREALDTVWVRIRYDERGRSIEEVQPMTPAKKRRAGEAIHAKSAALIVNRWTLIVV
jgi:hypothetical protein